MKFRAIVLALALLVAFGCTTTRAPVEPSSPRAEIVAEGLFDCFDPHLRNEGGRPLSCEISAVALADGRLVIANDQNGPETSPVATVPWDRLPLSKAPTPLREAPFETAHKYEAATTTPDGAWVLASTGFDRVDPDSARWHPYNTILYWPSENPAAVRVAHPTAIEGRESSIAVRWKLAASLADSEFPEGPPYFKVEGLAALPDGRLLFGVREIGEHYADFRYAVRVLAIAYRLEDGELRLEGDFETVYDVDLTGRVAGLSHPVGISSLEYDPYHDRLLFLTSFETGQGEEGLGAFLWSLPLERLAQGQAPLLVTGEDGSPFRLTHKAEGLAVIDAETLILLHDDDKTLGPAGVDEAGGQLHRQLHQAAWTVLRLR